jgi:peptide-methionine (R)-S-oxide reductase
VKTFLEDRHPTHIDSRNPMEITLSRRAFLTSLLALAGASTIRNQSIAAQGAGAAKPTTSKPFEKLMKPRAEWRKLLPTDRYRVLFEEATEPAGTSALNNEKREGTFVCAACNLPLFESKAKYESGTGWPSFFQPIAGAVGTKTDFKLIYPRTEYHCARCGGHQGHVFEDGPEPTGQRYCNNGLALEFVAKDQPMPALRT